MPSRLSSLLVRDGLVGVKRMEKAFQRQVIYGGSLDTTLLEMGLVPEERLTQYLALTSGLPPANRAECNVFDALAVQRCPARGRAPLQGGAADLRGTARCACWSTIRSTWPRSRSWPTSSTARCSR
jgi:hypothetical protein